MTRKPRADSTLKTLIEARQAELAAYLADHTLGEAKRWLAENGITTSAAALSEFLGWYQWREIHRRNATRVEGMLAGLEQVHPELSKEELFERGQEMFSLLAVEQQDAGGWAAIQRLNLEKGRTELEARRVALLEKRAAQADEAEEVAKSELTPEEKANRYREIFGMA